MMLPQQQHFISVSQGRRHNKLASSSVLHLLLVVRGLPWIFLKILVSCKSFKSFQRWANVTSPCHVQVTLVCRDAVKVPRLHSPNFAHRLEIEWLFKRNAVTQGWRHNQLAYSPSLHLLLTIRGLPWIGPEKPSLMQSIHPSRGWVDVTNLLCTNSHVARCCKCYKSYHAVASMFQLCT
jgi:hypothetical protein